LSNCSIFGVLNVRSHISSGNLYVYIYLRCSKRATQETPRGLIAYWQDRGRIPVPSSSGHILDALIVKLVEGAIIGQARVDALVEARATKDSEIKKFTVVISPDRPEKLSLPVLWVRDYEKTGEWV